MAIAFDAATALSTGTGNISATHTPAGTPTAAIVFVVQADSTDDVSTVTYGATGMTQVAGSPLIFSGGEKGVAHCFVLYSSVPAGARTVTVTGGGGSKAKAGVVITLTGAGTISSQDIDVSIAAAAQTNPSVTLGLGGNTCFCAIGFMSGQDATTGITPLTNWTSIFEHDFGSQTAGFYRYDIVGSTDVTAGWTQASSDATMIAIAVTTTNAFSLSADAGAYNITGTAATLRHAWRMAANGGSYVITGADATPKHGWKVAADAASYLISGSTAGLNKGKRITADAGSYLLSGTAASLVWTHRITAGAGSYALTGTSATLRRMLQIVASPGSYTITGADVSFVLTGTPDFDFSVLANASIGQSVQPFSSMSQTIQRNVKITTRVRH